MSAVDHKPGLIGSVLAWLRKGYPDGVPPTDYIPLLALLRRRLTEVELDTIVGNLIDSGHWHPDRAEVKAAISEVAEQEPTDEDLSLVAARLAAAGWPLAELDPSEGKSALLAEKSSPTGHGPDLARPAFLRSILGWLKEGYPQGVPAKDYIPLLALLRRRLSDEETLWVAEQIVASGRAPVGVADLGVLITKVTNELPSEDEVDRVRRQLEVVGWQLVPPTVSD